jgi:hypothetical protein
MFVYCMVTSRNTSIRPPSVVIDSSDQTLTDAATASQRPRSEIHLWTMTTPYCRRHCTHHQFESCEGAESCSAKLSRPPVYWYAQGRVTKIDGKTTTRCKYYAFVHHCPPSLFALHYLLLPFNVSLDFSPRIHLLVLTMLHEADNDITSSHKYL